MTIVVGMIGATVILSLAWARRRCRAHFTWRRFHKNLLSALVFLCLLPAPLLIMLMLLQGCFLGDVGMLLGSMAAMVATLFGTALGTYVLVAVYLVITHRTPAFEQRFRSVFEFDVVELPIPPHSGVAPERKETA
jgi:4-amino-4-deoxy-L-arabinose transferase-like glycosyltransferase